jgi:nicotinamidase/pyrazinamidase
MSKTVFFDIDTQIDFVYPAGALYVPGAERILPAVARLNRFAAENGIPLVSTTDAHAEDDPEFRQWPPHCVAGTMGQRKPEATLLARRVVVPTVPGDYPVEGAEQIIVEKQALDCFTNPNLPRILERLDAGRCVVYGVVTEYCVRCAALGLLRLGKPVEVVTDAIQTLKEEDGRRALEEIVAAGGRLTTTDDVVARKAA